MRKITTSALLLIVPPALLAALFLSCAPALPAPDSEAANLARALADAPNAALIFDFNPRVRQRFLDSFPAPDGNAGRFAQAARVSPLVCDENRSYLADTAAFFDQLRADYPGYGWFGGDARWDRAFAATLADLAWRPGKRTFSDFLDTLDSTLAFMQDRHFWVSGRKALDLTPRLAPDLVCLPAGPDWLVLVGAETRLLARDPANDWFAASLKPGLREDGSIAWFSVLSASDATAGGKRLIHLEGGWFPLPDWRELKYWPLAKAAALARDFTWEERDGVGILRYPVCHNGDGSDIDGFRASAGQARGMDCVLIDLRGNQGGSSWAGQHWMGWFRGSDQPSNAGAPFAYDRGMGDLSALMPLVDAELDRLPRSGDSWLAPKEKQDNLSLVLIDGAVGSSGENFANDALAGQHSLAVGANSGGYIQFGNLRAAQVGPRQILSWRYGPRLYFGFEGGAKEGSGIKPALYCPPELAEARSLAFLKRYGVERIKQALDKATAARSAAFAAPGEAETRGG